MKYIKSFFLFLCIMISYSGCSLIDTETGKNAALLTPTPGEGMLFENSEPTDFSTESGSFFDTDLMSNTITSTIDYFNYVNQTPLLLISNYIYEFSYNGTVTCTNKVSQEQFSFHLTDKLDVASYLDEVIYLDNWYFMGAVRAEHYIFLHYDYLGTTQLTFFLRMDLTCETVTILTANPYSENELLNCYTVTDRYIYYTFLEPQEGGMKTSIIKTDLDGSNGTILCSFEPGYKIRNLYPQKNTLYFIRETEDGIQSLLNYQLADSTLSIILDNCTADFLYIYDRYILLGIANDSYLNYYSITEQKHHTLYLSAENIGYFSVPLLLQNDLYFALHSWDDGAPTKLARLNLTKNKIEDYILLSYDFKHSIGTLGTDLLVEDRSEYKTINIQTKQEEAVY